MMGERLGGEATLWRGDAPLILASKSKIRRVLLAAAALDAQVIAPVFDERKFESEYLAAGEQLSELASAIARAKALAASAMAPQAFCLAADQTLTVEGRVLHKPADLQEASDNLAVLAGKTHRLTSAFSVARSGRTLVVDADYADLHMRQLSAQEISGYLEFCGARVLSSVGAYQIESVGVHLFEWVRGDHATVLGLPIQKLSAWLRSSGLISLIG